MFSELPVRAQQWRDFASAHSRGLRLKPLCSLSIASSLPQRIRAGCDARHLKTDTKYIFFATAHSCGLRLLNLGFHFVREALPQRIRAGCDCGKAMQRTANLLREGR